MVSKLLIASLLLPYTLVFASSHTQPKQIFTDTVTSIDSAYQKNDSLSLNKRSNTGISSQDTTQKVDTLQTLPLDSNSINQLTPGSEIDTISEEEIVNQVADTSGNVSRPAPDSSTQLQDSIILMIKKAAKLKPYRFLYPGMSEEQDKLANSMADAIFSFEWETSDRIARKMQRLESKDHLPPMSYLLMVTTRVLRISNNEYANEKEEKELLDQAEKLSIEGLAKIAGPFPDSFKLTNMLIEGGIKGFSATLKIKSNPVEAGVEGLKALKLLEQVVEANPRIKDAYLGMGIFYCALAKGPAIVKSALNMMGRNVSLDKGLDYLRISANEGYYTTVLAKQYLVQFLSPYFGHLVEEKKKVFKSLQRAYPHNPYFVFLEIDEALCFNPDLVFELGKRDLFRKKVRLLRGDNYSSKRYLNLVKRQCSLINPALGFTPDTTFDLREFSYYPLFLQAIEINLASTSPVVVATSQKHRVPQNREVKKIGEKALKQLDQSEMNLARKGFYEWHIKDALR